MQVNSLNSNVSSLIAQRQLDASRKLTVQSLERLSSGLNINRAADDAAGISVSERLRSQILGLAEAIGNGQDAINLVATAESGIDQSTSILQRMRELAIQSANDTLVNSDREAIQAEIDQLSAELTRVAETTEFNTRPLLDGSVAPASPGSEPGVEIAQNVNVGDASAPVPNLEAFISEATVSEAASVDVAFEINFVSYQSGQGAPVSTAIEVRSSVEGLLTSIELDNGAASDAFVSNGQISLTLGTVTIGTLSVNAAAVTLADVGKSALVQVTGSRAPVTTDQSLTFQVGANEGQFVKAGIDDLRAQALGLETLSIAGSSDADSRLRAQSAIGQLDSALGTVGSVRSRLGAFQNRIEYTISSLQVARENLSTSESRIRDTDYAATSSRLAAAQIREQANIAMLAQANLRPQAVSQLLG